MNQTNKQQMISIIDRYKRKNIEDSLISLPIVDECKNVIGFLRPVTADYSDTIENCVEQFSQWRKNAPTLSLARFTITNERTNKWLKNIVIENDNRILFMVQNAIGKNIGHIGFAGFRYEERAAEVDSVLRGEKECPKRIMEYALKTLIKWGKEVLELKFIDLEVWSQNPHAIAFYHRCGFVDDKLIPLRKIEEKNEIRWVPDENPLAKSDMYYLHMILDNKNEVSIK